MSGFGFRSVALRLLGGEKGERRGAGILVLALVGLLLGLNPPAATGPAPGSEAGGVLEGRVIFEGAAIPRATQVENTTDLEGCARLQSLENIVVSARNRGIQNVIVALKDVPLPPGYRPPPSRLVLANRDCRFRPHAAVLTIGSRIEVVNSDPIFHTVHLYSLREQNLAMPPDSSKVVQRVSQPGYIIVKCDIHGWMQAFLRVDGHPYHSVSGADGRFRIENIPPGSYTVEVWHEYFGPQEARVTVEAGSVSHLTLYYRSPG
ncbi:MAG: carboxypeptidase regulatory-like domain-containing protein [Terriglobia bacterium]